MSPANLLKTLRNLNHGLTYPKPESVLVELPMTMLENLPEASLLYRDFTNTPEYTNGDWDSFTDGRAMQRLVT